MTVPEDISELCANPATILEQYKNSGVKVFGYTCSYVPEELILSAGFQPYRISNIGVNSSALVPSFVCPFSGAVLENILRHEDYFRGFIVAQTCDPMWRLYDILKKKTAKPIFLLRVPHNTDNEASLEFFKKEFDRLKIFLEENSGDSIDDEKLFKAIQVCNENRSLLKNIYISNKDGKCSINAMDRFQLTLASMWIPKSEVNAKIKECKFDSPPSSNVRLHLNGTAVYDLNLLKIVEECGGFIASDDLCTGSRYFWDNVENTEDPIQGLTNRYLKRTPCAPQGPLESRLEYISFMVKEFKALGVITFTERFCDPILYDSVHLRNNLKKEGMPTTIIDYENPAQEIGRIKTRVEAFIESLGD
ncbi:MAG: 2-hydroxyacyl-CoA dehydratase subunit D [Candidatus Baldrarchaeia archaeon]